MRVKIVQQSELMKDNPTLCLSPLRVFERCHECDLFQQRFNAAKRRYPDKSVDEVIDLALNTVSCRPRLKQEWIELLKKKTVLLQQLNKIQKQMDAI